MEHKLAPNASAMLAVGGTIGTGLFFSVAAILRLGPVIALASVGYIAFLVILVLNVAAEMAVFWPRNGSVCVFLCAFLSPALGWANSIVYWLSWGLTYALELSILASMAKCGAWGIVGLWTAMLVLNLLPVDWFGAVELYISMVKVVAILAWIVLAFARLLQRGAVYTHWSVEPSVESALALGSGLVFASFLFQSVELVAISAGDVEEPEKSIPQVVRLLLWRIVVFYLVSVLLLALSVDPHDPLLVGASASDILSLPFVIALANLGFADGAVARVAQAVLFSAILSAANSNIYFGSRCLEAMSTGYFGRCNRHGVPVPAVVATALFGLVALLVRFHSIATLFTFLLSCCASAGMLMWCLLCYAHAGFRRHVRAKGLELKFTSRWNLGFWAPFAAGNFTVILAASGLPVFWRFTWLGLCGAYLTQFLFLGLWLVARAGTQPFTTVLGQI